jgi:hypothetical protein
MECLGILFTHPAEELIGTMTRSIPVGGYTFRGVKTVKVE